MGYEFLSIDRRGPVEHVTLNRPDVRNAFNEHVIAELTAWAKAAHADASLRAVVFAGAGKVFSAGADAAWMAKMADYSEADNVRDARAGAGMFLAINTSSVQLIPATVVALRASAGAPQPADVVGPTLLATLFSTAVGITAAKLLARTRLARTGDGP